MRDILFRGKRLDNGVWIEGFFVEKKYPLRESDVCSAFILAQHGDSFVWYPVDPSTVGQYTGLMDKNGKRIWEGDVVRCGTGRICKVTFFISPGFSGFDLVPVVGFYAPPPNKWLLFADTDIAGNIHDNQELLEGGASE